MGEIERKIKFGRCAGCGKEGMLTGGKYKGKAYCSRCLARAKLEEENEVKCSCGHKVKRSFVSVIKGKTYCPYCASRKHDEVTREAARKYHDELVKRSARDAERKRSGAHPYDPDWIVKVAKPTKHKVVKRSKKK
jgi:ribosomal protein L44E